MKPQLPDNDARRLARVEQGQSDVVTSSPDAETGWVIQGPRTDLAAGVGPRLRIGFDASATPVMIIERWSEAGARTTATFS